MMRHGTHTRRTLQASAAAFIMLGAITGMASAQEKEGAERRTGVVDFRISCSREAQREFNQGITLLHHMTYPRARRIFEQIAARDSACAMAHWGVAMTLFQPLWPTRPTPGELRRGWDEVEKARSLAPPSRRELLLIDAAAAFFRDPQSTDYWSRIRRWEEAMKKVHEAYPDDDESTALYALALLAVAPPDAVTSDNAARAAELLGGVYERHPGHPGAMHYLVHANDTPAREHESLEITRRYESTAPRNPHALHMPTHIYTRLGEWDAVIRGNLLAAEAALEQPAGDAGQYVWDEFPHAIEYLVYAYLQQGKDDKAAAQLGRLQSTERLQPSFKTAFHLASTRARYALERHAWGEAAALVPRDPPALDWDRFTWAEAVTWFARGLGAAHEGRVDDARAAGNRLDTLEAAARAAREELFARNIHILRLEVAAWLANAERRGDSSVALMREAAELEVATPKHAVTPGPTLPAYELLGELLLEQARPADALIAFKRSLELYPRQFNALLGAARAAKASGDDASARAYYQELLRVAGGATRASALGEARAALSSDR